MRVALVGNNDGPLVLAKSMAVRDMRPVCIGLQKPVSGAPKCKSRDLRAEYVQLVGEENFFSDFKEPRLLEALEAFEFDILINCFCNFKFKKLLDRYTVLNVHLAPLPKYRGRHPMHAALINGETEFGFTVHKMNADFDAGAIYWQKKFPIKTGMSVEELRSALMEKLAAGFGHFLEECKKGNIKTFSNPDTEASYAPKRVPEDSLLTEWHDRDTVYRKVMALRSESHPAFLKIGGAKVVVTAAALENEKFRPTESASVLQIYDDGVSMVCEDGKSIRLFGFDPKAYPIKENQKI